MSDSEKFSNNSPDLQDAMRSIGAIGEDSGAITGDGPDAIVPDNDSESDIDSESNKSGTTDSDR